MNLAFSSSLTENFRFCVSHVRVLFIRRIFLFAVKRERTKTIQQYASLDFAQIYRFHGMKLREKQSQKITQSATTNWVCSFKKNVRFEYPDAKRPTDRNEYLRRRYSAAAFVRLHCTFSICCGVSLSRVSLLIEVVANVKIIDLRFIWWFYSCDKQQTESKQRAEDECVICRLFISSFVCFVFFCSQYTSPKHSTVENWKQLVNEMINSAHHFLLLEPICDK